MWHLAIYTYNYKKANKVLGDQASAHESLRWCSASFMVNMFVGYLHVLNAAAKMKLSIGSCSLTNRYIT